MIDKDFKIPEELEEEFWEIKKEQKQIHFKMEGYLDRFKELQAQREIFSIMKDTSFLILLLNLNGKSYNEGREENELLQLKKERFLGKLRRVVPKETYDDLRSDLGHVNNHYLKFSLPFVDPRPSEETPQPKEGVLVEPPPVKHEKPPVKSLFSKIVGVFS